MQNINDKRQQQISICSTIAHNSVVTGPSWWNSSGSHMEEPSLSNNLSLNLNSSTQSSHQAIKLGQKLQEQEFPLIQTVDQSNQEFVSIGEGNSQEHLLSSMPENNADGEKRVDSLRKPVFSLGAPEILYPGANIDYGQSIVSLPCPYPDPCYGGIMSVYGQPAIIHPQMMGISSDRVPLPVELAEDGPIYVNAKQYRGILRRRQLRAKLMAQNKHVKNRKPYLHESRHRHAMKRVRGSGGRFLNTKQLQEQNLEPQSKYTFLTSDGKKNSGFPTPTSVSGVTISSSNNCMFQISDSLGFSDCHSHEGRGMQGGLSMMRKASPPQRVPVIR